MDLRDLNAAIKQAPHGRQKMLLLRKGWEIADKEKEYDLQILFRILYIQESVFYDDAMEMFLVYPEILKIYDQYEKEYGYDSDEYDILWYYKWLIENATDFYQVSIEQFELFFEDCKKRYLQKGYSLRPIYQHRYIFYLNIDKEMAREAYTEFVNCDRDAMSDCHACERSSEVGYFLAMGEPDRAASKAAPLLNGQLTCGEEPEVTLGRFLYYYNGKIADGERDYVALALEVCEKIRRSNERNGIVPFLIPQVLLFYAMENPTKALNYYKKNWSFYETCKNPTTRFWFAIAALRFFKNMGEKKTYKMKMERSYPFYNENDTYDVEMLRKYYRDVALDIAKKMDARNRNTVFRDIFYKFLQS